MPASGGCQESAGIRVVGQEGAENGKRIGDISAGDWLAFNDNGGCTTRLPCA